MKIGLLGGTFNPVHTGHLVLAQECWHKLELDKIVFVPTFITPLKEDVEEQVSVHDRLNMLRMTLENDERFEISTYELDKGGVSYTIDMLKAFRKKYDYTVELFFLTGADSVLTLSEWKEPEKILGTVNFVIASRPGCPDKSSFDDKIIRIEIPLLDVSSTMIRERIKRRDPIDYLVPEKVVKYIRNKGLYR